jgi:hypothetical protein
VGVVTDPVIIVGRLAVTGALEGDSVGLAAVPVPNCKGSMMILGYNTGIGSFEGVGLAFICPDSRG